MTPDGDPPRGADRAELLEALHDRIRATAELPVDPEASRWLGEAEAIAADVATDVGSGGPSGAVVDRRVTQIRELLQGAGGIDNPEADEHVAAALELADRILAQQ